MSFISIDLCLLLPYVKRLSNEYYIDVFCLKASLPIKGYVSKNLVVLRGEEVFNLVKKLIK